jgi:hypothetical protein
MSTRAYYRSRLNDYVAYAMTACNGQPFKVMGWSKTSAQLAKRDAKIQLLRQIKRKESNEN